MPASQTLLLPDPRPLVERLGEDFFWKLPKRPGVYLMHDFADAVLYVGKAKNLRQRLGHYRVANPDRMARRHLRMLRQVTRIELEECTDESAALAREAELLLALKPPFNRAGVWPGTPRFLCWRRVGSSLEFACSTALIPGWNSFGPFGAGMVYLRAAVIRLLWHSLNPASGSIAMPAGWVRGQLGSIATIKTNRPEVDQLLSRLFNDDSEAFVVWMNECTQSLAYDYDREMRDADLETLTSFLRAKTRRPRTFIASETAIKPADSSGGMLSFMKEDGISHEA